MSIKVLHISHMYPFLGERSYGIAIHKYIKSIKKQGVLNRVVCPVPWSPFPLGFLRRKWRIYQKVPRFESFEGIEVFYPRYLDFPKNWFFSTSGYRMYLGVVKTIDRILEDFDFDIIHAHAGLPDGFAAMLLSQRIKKPFVVTFRATDLDITVERSRFSFLALSRVFKSAGQVIAPAPRLAKQFYDYFGFYPRVLEHGIDPQDIFYGESSLAYTYSDYRVLLSVSRLIPTKGIDLNLYALSKLLKRYKDIIYIIVGDGPERKRLEGLASELGLADRVVFAGQVPYREVMEYMSISYLFSLPSWQETFGLVYIEAMAHGKPVVAVKGQGVDGIVVHGETGLLVEPRNVDSLVQALDFLLGAPEKARIIGRRARELVLSHYTWDKIAKKAVNIYEQIVDLERR